MSKRLIDIVLSAIVLIILAPVLLLIAIWIKKDSTGSVFYRSLRLGRNGKPFKMYKFRTMVENAPNLGGPDTPVDDPRITKSGRFLRRLNLDEIPQFIDVFRGDMSIVGPRPEVPERVAMFPDEYQTILKVRPGITDWATLLIRDEGKILEGSDDPEKAYLQHIWPEKSRLGQEYVRTRSVWIDFKIMLMTIKSHLIDRLKNQSDRSSQGQ